jgi:hypothetical protein
MNKKLTPWFPATFNPVRKGWYEVSDGGLHHRSGGKLVGRPYRWWTGRRWMTASAGLGWSYPSIFGTHWAHQWRGLAEKP